MNQPNISEFINMQVEVAISIERVRLAEKFISEKQMNFEMQYAIDLLHQALSGFEKLKHMGEQTQASPSEKLLELGDLSWLEAR